MANIKSAKKRIEVSERNHDRNVARKSEIKTYVKKFDQALETEDKDQAVELLKQIDKKSKKAALKGAISENSARHTVSRLQKKLNAVENAD